MLESSFAAFQSPEPSSVDAHPKSLEMASVIDAT